MATINDRLLSPVEVVMGRTRVEATTLTTTAEQRHLGWELSPILLCKIRALEGRING